MGVILLLPAPAPVWFNSASRPPEHGWIAARWKTGQMWAGKFDGNPKVANCDEWQHFPKGRGHVKDGIVTFTPKQG